MSLTRKRRSTGKVTLADVAQLAGVGTMTVSRALRTPEQVSDKLREKIEAAVQELGYMPNLAASALASASSWTIAMVVPNLSEAGCSEMFAGLQQVLQPAGYQIMLAESQHRLEQEEKLLETLLASNIAAAILLSVEHSDTVRHWLKNASIPVMEMGAMRADPIDMNIGIDNVAAMYELTEMVIQRGYQNIGLLCANQEQWIFQQHLQGWYKAMLRHHLAPNRVINAAMPPNFSTGAAQLPEFLLAWPELDALVCVSDELACGALYECQRRRIKVPDDLAVVGFGDSDVSRVCQPPLKTMAVLSLFLFFRLIFRFSGFVFGVAGHPQRQCFKGIRREFVATRGDLFRRHPAHFAHFLFLQGERSVGNAAKQPAPDATMLIFEIKLSVLGKRHASDT